MRLSAVIRAVVWTFRRRPDDLFPFYFLGVAIPAIVRLVPFVAIGFLYVYLELTGRLDIILDELATGNGMPPDPEADPEGFETWLEGQQVVFEQLVTPTTVIVLLGTLVVTIVLALFLYAAVSAGQLATCYARLRDERGLTAGIAGFRRYWVTFLGLFFLELFLWFISTVTVGGIALLVAAVLIAVTGSPAVGMLVAVPLFLVWLVLVVAIRAIFAFAPVAVIVDDVGVFPSVTSTMSFIRTEPLAATFYYVLAVGSFLALSTVSAILAIVDVFVLGSLLSALVLLPALDLLKTTLYGRYRRSVAPPRPPDRTLRSQCSGGLRRGWHELGLFVRETPVTHLAIVAIGVGTFWLGWIAADPLVGVYDTSIRARIAGIVPPAAAIEFFANNWLVSVMTAFSGLAFVVPAIASIAFNGVVFGVTARLEISPIELLAFVIPHGIFEIPAIVVAGSLGVYLGVVFWRVLRSRATRSDLADAMERAFWVAVGIGLLLAIAAIIEGFVSPFYFRLFL